MRVCVIGNSGSGKSTLAAKIGEEAGATVLELGCYADVWGGRCRRALGGAKREVTKQPGEAGS